MSRFAIPPPIAWRGSRASSANFTAARACARDPAGFLAFVEQLLARERFDVLLPTHEQGFLFARMRARLEGRAGVALPSFESYRTAHSKAGFSRLLDQLKLPQPPTRIVKSARELRDAIGFPAVVKTSIGTASRGIWFVRNADDLEMALHDLGAGDAFADEVLAQDLDHGHHREGAVGVLPGTAGRLSCLSAGRRSASAAARRSSKA